MKKYLTIYIAILAITFCLSTTNYAQFGNILNKAKDAIDKKKDKKKQDEPPTNQPTNSDSSTGNSNDTKPNKQTVQENPLGKILLSNKSFDGNNSDNKTTFTHVSQQAMKCKGTPVIVIISNTLPKRPFK